MHGARDIFRRKIEKNYSELVKLIINLQKYIDDSKKIQLNNRDK